jgi:hypothetical protein
MLKPTVGRTVRYRAYGTPGGEHPPADRAAIITEVDEPDNPESAVGLAVLNPTGIFFNQHVPYGQTGGQWHWPPREPLHMGKPVLSRDQE